MNHELPATTASMAADLRRLGVRPGGVLLVHASFKSLGPVEGGAEAVVRALLDAVGSDGTLMFPALSYATVHADNPLFDQQATPSCVGYLPEYFRTRPGTLRSLHPTHSVCAAGARARELLEHHELDDTPCGLHSPFRRLFHVRGQLLMLGCGLRPNTSMHAIEELSRPPYLFGPRIIYTIRPAGRPPFEMQVIRHAFEYDGRRYAQRYDRLGPLLAGEQGALREGAVAAAHCHLIEAETMWRVADAALCRDPFFFVEPATE